MSKPLAPIDFPEYREHAGRTISLTFIPINEDVIEQQSKLTSTVADFLANATSPVEAINALLAHWLLTQSHSANGINEDRLKIILRLVNFLYDLKTDLEGLEYFQNEAKTVIKDLQNKEEVSHG